MFGNLHPQSLQCAYDLGDMLCEDGEYDAAEALYRQVLEGRRSVLGSTHIETLNIANDLANLLSDHQGKPDEAEALYREALEGRRRELGESHKVTLDTIYNLGVHLREQGEPRLEEAEALQREALAGFRRTLGSDHLDSLWSMCELAQVQQAQGEYAEAEALHREALRGRRRVLGGQHSDTQHSLRCLRQCRRESSGVVFRVVWPAVFVPPVKHGFPWQRLQRLCGHRS